MDDMADFVMNLILVTVMSFIAISAWRFHRDKGHYANFNLVDLICTRDGRVSRPALMEMGVYVLMSWAFVTLTVTGKLSEWFAGLYVATFVARAAHSAWMAKDQNGDGKEHDSTTTTPTPAPVKPQ